MNKSKFRKLILVNSNLLNKSHSQNQTTHLHQSNSQLQTSKIPSLPLNINSNTNTTSSHIFEDSCQDLFSSRNNSLSHAFVFNINNLTNQTFSNKINDIMEQYKYNSSEIDQHKGDIYKLFPKISRNRYISDREKIKNILSKSKHFHKSKSVPNMNEDNDEKKIKFEFIQEHFKNPIQSYFLIQKNKLIYESMLQNFENFEKDTYKHSFRKLNPLLQRTFEKEHIKKYKAHQKVKISTKIPKIVDTSWFNQPNLINSKHKQPHRKHSTLSLSKFTDVININTNHKSNVIHLSVSFIQPLTDFPESREQFAFPQLGADCIMCGGLVSNTNTNTIWEFDQELLSWKKPFLNTIYPESRYGHSGIIHNKKLFIFGGKYLNISTLGDIEIYNLETKTWSIPSMSTYSKVKLRRNHIACLVGNHMFIHGGIDEDGNFLNDCHLLHLPSLKWLPCYINENTSPPILAYHKCCLVLPEEIRINRKLNIYRFPEITIKHPSYENIKERGIYIFGGKHNAEGKAMSDLYIVRIGKRPLEWAKIRTKGIGPIARYSCSLNYYEEGNCLVVHGGRNDGYTEEFSLNDTYVLDLLGLNWIRVEYCYEGKGMKMFNRCGHETLIYHHKLIIFGGMNSDSYLGSHLCVIDLSSGDKEDKEEDIQGKRVFGKKVSKKGKVMFQ